MIEDFKNVIITFGIIGIVFIHGSYSYQNKILSDSVAILKQENTQKIKNDIIAAKNNNLLLLQVKQQQDLLNQKITNTNIVSKTQTATSNTTSAQADILLAQKQAQAAILAKQKADTLLAQQQARALAQTTTIPPSRQSAAS